MVVTRTLISPPVVLKGVDHEAEPVPPDNCDTKIAKRPRSPGVSPTFCELLLDLVHERVRKPGLA
jgi:hypothetical protein